MAIDFDKLAEGLGRYWDQEPEPGDWSEFPDGTYKFRVQDAEFKVSQSDVWMAVFELVCVDDKSDMFGKTHYDHNQLDLEAWDQGEKLFQFPELKRKLYAMGYRFDEPSADSIREVIDVVRQEAPTIEASIKTSKTGFPRLKIRKVLDGREPIKLDGKKKATTAPEHRVQKQPAPGTTFAVGDRVSAMFGEEKFEGEITELGKEGIVVTFDDGDVQTYSNPLELTKVKADHDLTNARVLALAFGLEVDDDASKEDLVAALNAAKMQEDKLQPEELAIARRIGVELIPAPVKSSKKKAKRKKSGAA